MSAKTKFHSIEELVADIRDGKMVVLVDDEDRENEGDLVLAADKTTPALINFMALEARGLICLSLTAAQTDRLRLPPMVSEDFNHSSNKTAFTVSIEAAEGVSTGISAADRAHTIRVASNPLAKPQDVHMPGHVFPIRAREGGVLKRAGHTEGSVDLVRLAGLNPAAVICEVMNVDGSMARVPDLLQFAEKHGLKIGTIVDLIEYRLSREILVEEIYASPLPGIIGTDLKLRVFKSRIDGTEHLVLQKGHINPESEVVVRVQGDSFVRDLVSISKGESSLVQLALKAMHKYDEFVFVLVGRERSQAPLVGEVRALCGEVPPTEPDTLEYGVGAQILRSLGLSKIRLLTNRPEKRVGLRAFGLEVTDIISINS